MSESAGSVNTLDLAKELAASEVGKSLELSQAAAQRVIQQFVDLIAGHVADGDTVRIHQFGNLKVLNTKQRRGQNPKTKEPITIEAGKRVHLSVSQHLKEAAARGAPPVREPKTRAPKEAAAAAPTKKTPTKKAAPNGPAKTAATKGGFRPDAPKTDDL